MDYDTDEIPAVRRGERFTAEETNVLVREVRARKHRIYGSNGFVPKFQEVRKTWDEIAKIVSTIEGISRTGDKCRKRYNDVKRRGNQKMAAVMECTENYVENVEESPSAPTPDEEHGPEIGGLEIGHHVAEKEKRVKPGSETKRANAEEDRKATALSRRTSSVNALQPGDQPYLDLQQNGFNMLESELQGVRQVMASLHARMNSMEGLLQPIQLISDSLSRIANAMERLPRQ